MLIIIKRDRISDYIVSVVKPDFLKLRTDTFIPSKITLLSIKMTGLRAIKFYIILITF